MLKKKYLYLFLIPLFFSSCATSTLYNWGKYEKRTYKYFSHLSPSATDKLISFYRSNIVHPSGTRKVVAPGMYAEYGYLLLMQGKREIGIQMLENEVRLYPESEIFIKRILKSLHYEEE